MELGNYDIFKKLAKEIKIKLKESVFSFGYS